jgi:hypothetical protein
LSVKSGENVNGVWVKEFNTDTMKYIERDEDGNVLSERPLTDDEYAYLTAPPSCGSCGRPF